MFRTALAVCAVLATVSDVAAGPTDYLDIVHRKGQLIQHVVNGNYYEAVDMTKRLHNDGFGVTITEVLDRLIHSDSITGVKLMSFAYQLWNKGGSDVIRNHFPTPYRLMFGGKNISIVNKQFTTALKLGTAMDSAGDKAAFGAGHDKTSRRVCWQFTPTWQDNEVTFLLRNVDTNYYMKVGTAADYAGDHRVYGSSDHATNRHKFFLRPIEQDGMLYFYIVSSEYRQPLKPDGSADSAGDRALWSQYGALYPAEDRFKWLILEW